MKHLTCAGILALLFSLNSFAQTSVASRDAADNTRKSMETLFINSFLFSKGTINMPGDKGENKPAVQEAIVASDNTIKEFEAKVDEFIKSKPVATIVKSNSTRVTNIVHAVSIAIEQAATALNEYRVVSAVGFLQQLYLYRAYIKAAMKIYPEAISYEEKLELVENAIAQHGSREEYMAKLEKAKVDYLKSLRMKKAVMSDPAIEASTKKQYEADFASDKVTVTKVNITTGWVIEKNILDIPLHKEVQVNIAVKKVDGSCAIASGYMRCTYEGGGKYSAPTLLFATPPITIIPCENLK
jgi:hypothetical protein